MSTNITEVLAFVTAQREFVKSSEFAIDAEQSRQCAFAASAIAASAALKVKGVTLQRLADANLTATEDIAKSAPKGTLYTSVEAVAYHALTGDLLSLDFDEDHESDVIPMDVQTLIVKVKRVSHLGVKAVKAAIRQASSQQEAVENLREALKVPAPVTDEGTDESDESDESVTDEPVQTVETLLSRAIALIAEGAELTDSVRAMIGQLAHAATTVPLAA